jgi:hypothetical protein
MTCACRLAHLSRTQLLSLDSISILSVLWHAELRYSTSAIVLAPLRQSVANFAHVITDIS